MRIPHYRRANLFTAASASDGTGTGASEKIVGQDYPASIFIQNEGGATVVMQARRSTGIADWSEIGESAVVSLSLIVNFLAGYEYRFNIATAGSSSVVISSDAHENRNK